VADIDWAVISSGLDFLESAVDHLAKGGERELRYGALHVTAAIEGLPLCWAKPIPAIREGEEIKER
jgi:hypothetical protein